MNKMRVVNKKEVDERVRKFFMSEKGCIPIEAALEKAKRKFGKKS